MVGGPAPATVAATGPGAAPRRSWAGVAVAACVAVAVASLALPATLAFDPWAWLVWGREVGHLDLDTTGGPSWKPLPVLAATVLAPAGDHATTLWLVAARAAGLLALVAAFRLAARFAGPAAGAVAAGLLVLTPDGGPRFLRLVVEGHTAPLTATLCLWAVDRHLAGRHAQALLLISAFSLERPEAWPFLAAYALWLWRREPERRPLVAACLATVPVLWFGGDWWGSGDPWHGADAAQVVSGGIGGRLSLVGERVGKVVVTPAWVLAVVAVAAARRRGEHTLVVLAAGAVAWLALVGGMSVVLGYAALSRFLLPAASVLCVLAGIGVVRLLDAVPRGRPRVALAAVVVAASLPFVAVRASSIGVIAEGVTARARLEDDLDAAVRQAGGRTAVLGCGRVAVSRSDVPRVAMAWKLDVPLHRVERRLGGAPGVVFVRAGRGDDAALSASTGGEATELARSGAWAAFAVDCDPGARR